MFGNKLEKIEKLATKGKADALIALTSDKSEEVRLAAVRGLGRCDSDDAYNALVPLVHASNAAMRIAAINALADMKRPSGRVHIEHQMRLEKDEQALTAIQNALRKLKDDV